MDEKDPASVRLFLFSSSLTHFLLPSFLSRLLFFAVTVCVFSFLLVSMLKQDEPFFSIISSQAVSGMPIRLRDSRLLCDRVITLYDTTLAVVVAVGGAGWR